MSINLYSPFWKESIKFIVVFIVGFLVSVWFNGCSRNYPTPKILKVTVPEIIGKFKAKKPAHELIQIKANSLQLKKGKTVLVENPIDEELIAENAKLKADFAEETDSLKKVIAYNKAIQLNKFSSNFEDENLIINIDGIVQGEVKEITPNYIIKEKKVEIQVKQKQTVLRVLVGGGFGLNKEFNQAVYKLDLNFQNRKGDIISGEYLNIGGQSFGIVGFKKSLINIKR